VPLKLVWRASALADLTTIIGYIAERNLSAAEELQGAIENCAERLPEHPFLYRTGRVDGTREAVVHPNYILIYRVDTDAVEIVSVLHSRQQYP
jgi:addiction module RelE/StbE family toxin